MMEIHQLTSEKVLDKNDVKFDDANWQNDNLTHAFKV